MEGSYYQLSFEIPMFERNKEIVQEEARSTKACDRRRCTKDPESERTRKKMFECKGSQTPRKTFVKP